MTHLRKFLYDLGIRLGSFLRRFVGHLQWSEEPRGVGVVNLPKGSPSMDADLSLRTGKRKSWAPQQYIIRRFFK